MKASTRSRPAASDSATRSSASATVKAIGFSHRTCLPAFAAATVMGWCDEFGVQIDTAVIVGSLMSSLKSV
jgi:hypothetical protein